MEMTQYQKDLVRMWDSMRTSNKGCCNCYLVSCTPCPLNKVACSGNGVTHTLFNAEKAIEIVTQWAKDHPFVTYEQKYEETFGVKPINDSGEYICPSYLGFKPCKYSSGNGSPCVKCAKDFWHSEYRPPKREESES